MVLALFVSVVVPTVSGLVPSVLVIVDFLVAGGRVSRTVVLLLGSWLVGGLGHWAAGVLVSSLVVSYCC